MLQANQCERTRCFLNQPRQDKKSKKQNYWCAFLTHEPFLFFFCPCKLLAIFPMDEIHWKPVFPHLQPRTKLLRQTRMFSNINAKIGHRKTRTQLPPSPPPSMLFWPWCLPIQILWTSKQHWKRGGERTDTYAVAWALVVKAIGKYGVFFKFVSSSFVRGCSLALILNFPALDNHCNLSRALEVYPRLAPSSSSYVFLLVSTLVRVLPYWANALYKK